MVKLKNTFLLILFFLTFKLYYFFQIPIELKKQVYQYPLNLIQYRRLFEIDKPNEILSLPLITINLGTPNQKLKLIYNTGSQVTWVLRESETNILQKPFYSNLSKTFHKTDKIYELNYFTYGTLATSVKDILYFNNEINVEFYFFHLFFYSPNTLICDGEIGFARLYHGIYSDPYIVKEAINYSFLNELHIKNNISKIFSHKWLNNKKGILYIGELPFKKKIDDNNINVNINDYNENIVNITKCLNIINTGEISNYWNCRIDELIIGNEIVNISLNNKTIFSTGERFIFIPQEIGDIMFIYGNYSEWSRKNCFFYYQVAFRELHCKIEGFKFEYFPNLIFNFNGYIINVKPEDVFLINNNKYYRNIIVINNKKDFWILGFPAIKNHNMIFYDDGYVYFYNIKENFLNLSYIITFGIVIIIIFFLIYVLSKKNKKKKRKPKYHKINDLPYNK